MCMALHLYHEEETIIMRDISMERVNETRKKILDIIEGAKITHEQKPNFLANQADSL